MYKQAQETSILREILKALGYAAIGGAFGAGGAAGITALSRAEKKNYRKNMLYGGLAGSLGGLSTYGIINHLNPWIRRRIFALIRQQFEPGGALELPDTLKTLSPSTAASLLGQGYGQAVNWLGNQAVQFGARLGQNIGQTLQNSPAISPPEIFHHSLYPMEP